jgi:hypothetical protein
MASIKPKTDSCLKNNKGMKKVSWKLKNGFMKLKKIRRLS